MTERDEILAKRFRWAEGQALKDRPPEIRRKWFKTRCPGCKEQVQYSPKENWDGLLRCGSCGHEFRLAILDHFSIEFEKVVNCEDA